MTGLQAEARTDLRSSPLRVVHVITTLTTGGAERQLELLTGRSAHHVAVIALYEGGPVADSLRAAGVPVQVLGMRGWRKPLTWFRLAATLRSYRADVVHVHLLAAQLWGIPAARLAQVPVIVSTEHSLMSATVEGRPRSAGLGRLYRVLERLSSHTVAVSSTTATRLQDWNVRPDRITVVDNGIDFEALAYSEPDRQAVRTELGLTPATVVLGAVGRLDPVKRLDQVIRAVAPRLRAGGSVLVVAGVGMLQSELRELTRELGIADAVHWLGARPDMPRVLSALDVLISASQDETFGMAVIEAISSGLPVVFAACPALEELDTVPAGAIPVRAATGSDEVTALADALDKAMAAGVRRCPVPTQLRERYGADRAAADVDALYRRLTIQGGTKTQ